MLSLEKSNTLQRALIKDYCEVQGLDKKTGALQWCTDGHAEQCRKLIDLGFGEEYINNRTIEIMITTKSSIDQLVSLSLMPWKLYKKLMQASTDSSSNSSSI